MRRARQFFKRQKDGTSPVSCGKDFIYQPADELGKIKRRRLIIHFARVEAADEQHLFHQRRHPARVFLDGLKMLLSLIRLESVEIIVQNLGGGLYNSERRTK